MCALSSSRDHEVGKVSMSFSGLEEALFHCALLATQQSALVSTNTSNSPGYNCSDVLSVTCDPQSPSCVPSFAFSLHDFQTQGLTFPRFYSASIRLDATPPPPPEARAATLQLPAGAASRASETALSPPAAAARPLPAVAASRASEAALSPPAAATLPLPAVAASEASETEQSLRAAAALSPPVATAPSPPATAALLPPVAAALSPPAAAALLPLPPYTAATTAATTVPKEATAPPPREIGAAAATAETAAEAAAAAREGAITGHTIDNYFNPYTDSHTPYNDQQQVQPDRLRDGDQLQLQLPQKQEQQQQVHAEPQEQQQQEPPQQLQRQHGQQHQNEQQQHQHQQQELQQNKLQQNEPQKHQQAEQYQQPHDSSSSNTQPPRPQHLYPRIDTSHTSHTHTPHSPPPSLPHTHLSTHAIINTNLATPSTTTAPATHTSQNRPPQTPPLSPIPPEHFPPQVIPASTLSPLTVREHDTELRSTGLDPYRLPMSPAAPAAQFTKLPQITEPPQFTAHAQFTESAQLSMSAQFTESAQFTQPPQFTAPAPFAETAQFTAQIAQSVQIAHPAHTTQPAMPTTPQRHQSLSMGVSDSEIAMGEESVVAMTGQGPVNTSGNDEEPTAQAHIHREEHIDRSEGEAGMSLVDQHSSVSRQNSNEDMCSVASPTIVPVGTRQCVADDKKSLCESDNGEEPSEIVEADMCEGEEQAVDNDKEESGDVGEDLFGLAESRREEDEVDEEEAEEKDAQTAVQNLGRAVAVVAAEPEERDIEGGEESEGEGEARSLLYDGVTDKDDMVGDMGRQDGTVKGQVEDHDEPMLTAGGGTAQSDKDDSALDEEDITCESGVSANNADDTTTMNRMEEERKEMMGAFEFDDAEEDMPAVIPVPHSTPS
eukprot:GHVQ01020796.1.p1 GENE.GHVQ01020796.1~~GHVQ01020796.1.p1  ORF type:complete len:889 (-),score=269.22 GHVQ01020796.1:1971-4637(-)